MELPIYLIGFLSALITELIKFFPFIGKNKAVNSAVAIVLCAIGVFFFTGKFTFEAFVESVLYALGSYKMLVQPTFQLAGSKTQK